MEADGAAPPAEAKDEPRENGHSAAPVASHGGDERREQGSAKDGGISNHATSSTEAEAPAQSRNGDAAADGAVAALEATTLGAPLAAAAAGNDAEAT